MCLLRLHLLHLKECGQASRITHHNGVVLGAGAAAVGPYGSMHQQQQELQQRLMTEQQRGLLQGSLVQSAEIGRWDQLQAQEARQQRYRGIGMQQQAGLGVPGGLADLEAQDRQLLMAQMQAALQAQQQQQQDAGTQEVRPLAYLLSPRPCQCADAMADRSSRVFSPRLFLPSFFISLFISFLPFLLFSSFISLVSLFFPSLFFSFFFLFPAVQLLGFFSPPAFFFFFSPSSVLAQTERATLLFHPSDFSAFI